MSETKTRLCRNELHPAPEGGGNCPECRRLKDHRAYLRRKPSRRVAVRKGPEEITYGASPLDADDVRRIRAALQRKTPAEVLARQFGVSSRTILRIGKRETWGWVD